MACGSSRTRQVPVTPILPAGAPRPGQAPHHGGDATTVIVTIGIESQGGKTDLDGGVLLCSWHHHRIHDHDRLPSGDIRFRRRR